MSEILKTANVVPASRSIAANSGQLGVSLPAVPALRSGEKAQLQKDLANENVAGRKLPAPFQLKGNNTDVEIQPAAQLETNNTSVAVVQRVFNQHSVEEAIMGANRGMKDMGGTTGGAFHLITNAQDRDVKELVLKASGKHSAAIASEIYNMVGIPAPRALMLPVSNPLIDHLGTLVSGAAQKFGSQSSIEVQQHTNVVNMPDSVSNKSPSESIAAVLAGDTLTGNHDRIHSKNAENFSKGFAIDNVVKDDTLESRAMMGAANGIIQNSSVIHKQILKIYQLAGFASDSSSGQIETLNVQKAFLSGLQRIGVMSYDIMALIKAANLQEDEQGESMIVRLTKMNESDVPIQNEPIERVVAQISKDDPGRRKEIIMINIESTGKKIGTNRYAALTDRLEQITKWHEDGEIATALELIERKIEKISSEYAEKKEIWDSNRSKAEVSANMQWEDLNYFSQLVSNKQKFIQDILKGWEGINPKPL